MNTNGFQEEMEKVDLRSVIDLEFLQRFQDDFSEAVGVASITVDLDGNPVTKPSGFTNFCMKLVRGSSKGLERCMRCDSQGGQRAATDGKPAIYGCHAGLVDFAAPIMLAGRQIGSILGGQVLERELTEEEINKMAQDLGIDPQEAREALSVIKPIPRRKIEKAADLLYGVAGNISEMGYQRKKVKEAIEILNGNLDQITAAIQQMAAFTEQVSTNQNELNAKIQEIHQLSGKIDAIVEAIKVVSKRSKMLGINASIEAARAREAGVGFAVVAKEIQKLSDDSREMSNKITDFTNNIQETVRQTEKMSEESLVAAQQQTSVAQEIAASIQEINGAANHLLELVSQEQTFK